MSLIAEILSHLVSRTIGPRAQISPQELATAAHHLAQDRRSKEAAALAMFCRQFSLAYQNFDYNLPSNGEAWLLERLVPFRPHVIFDVGANVGEWTVLAHRHHPAASIHAFEIVPATFAELARRLGTEAGWLHLNPFGLAAVAGEIMMNHFAGAHALSTFTEYPHGTAQKLMCPVRAGDEYLATKILPRIDFLKIDVEGAEHLVLQGFKEALDRGAIDLIQFEYGRVNILTRFLLMDFHHLLESKGYLVGKLYPDGVKFQPYAFEDEDFLGPNFIACRKVRSDLVEALRWRY